MLVFLGMSPGHPVVITRTPCGHPQDTLWSTAPYIPAMMSPFLQHRWSSLKAPVTPSASQQRLLRPFCTPRHWLKWQILLMLTKEKLCHLSGGTATTQSALESLCSLWMLNRETDSQQVISNPSWTKPRECEGFLLPLISAQHRRLYT